MLSVGWLGAYLTNGKRLVQVIGLEQGGLRAEDARSDFDNPDTVLIPNTALVAPGEQPGWWLVVREDQREAA